METERREWPQNKCRTGEPLLRAEVSRFKMCGELGSQSVIERSAEE